MTHTLLGAWRGKQYSKSFISTFGHVEKFAFKCQKLETHQSSILNKDGNLHIRRIPDMMLLLVGVSDLNWGLTARWYGCCVNGRSQPLQQTVQTFETTFNRWCEMDETFDPIVGKGRWKLSRWRMFPRWKALILRQSLSPTLSLSASKCCSTARSPISRFVYLPSYICCVDNEVRVAKPIAHFLIAHLSSVRDGRSRNLSTLGEKCRVPTELNQHSSCAHPCNKLRFFMNHVSIFFIASFRLVANKQSRTQYPF